MCFSIRKKVIKKLHITIDSKTIEVVNEFIYLGVVLDPQLKGCGMSITPPTAQLQKMQEKGGQGWGGVSFCLVSKAFSLSLARLSVQ